jgi:hypothetical protein
MRRLTFPSGSNRKHLPPTKPLDPRRPAHPAEPDLDTIAETVRRMLKDAPSTRFRGPHIPRGGFDPDG